MKQAEPGGARRGVQDESDYEWISLSDFSAGCYDYTSIAGAVPIIPGPKGALDAGNTFSCVALPSGGLGPLPGIGISYQWTDTHATLPAINYVTGLLVHDEIGQPEAISMIEWDDGANHFFIADSFAPFGPTFTRITSTTNPSGGLNEFPFGSPYPQMTRAADPNPTTTPGNPVCVFPVASFAYPNATAGQLFMYPNPTTPTSYTPKKLITDTTPQSLTGMVLVHENRVVVLANTGYGWPLGGAGAYVINEEINFTDPPNSDIYPADTATGQQLVAVAEEPYGFGCGGSISTGELVLIKRRGGAAIINGDLFAPTSIINLPGVQPTGQGYGNADSGQQGLAYCSINQGAWLWNGSNTSQKISQQLDDKFFVVPNSGIYLSWYTKWVGDKLYFSNNWMLDTRTNSWWRYYPDDTQGGRTFFWIQPDGTGSSIYCSPLIFTSADTHYLYRFDETLPATSWQAQTLPIRVTTKRWVELRQVVVRASSNLGNGAATIEVEVLAGATVVGHVTTPATIGARPTMIRMPIGSVNAPGGTSYASEDLTIRIIANGNGGAAPNLHSCELGYNVRAQSPTIGVSG